MRRFIFGLFLSIALASTVHADTLSQIRSDIRFKIQDSTAAANSTTWTDPELNRRINAVQRFVARATYCLYAEVKSTPTAGVREYAKPANCITIDRVSFIEVSSTSASNQYKKLTYTTMGGLDRDRPGWESFSNGLPRYYYERGNNIGFEYPVSSVYCSTGAIKVDYYKYPADMSSDSDEPYDGEDHLQMYSDAIVLGVAAQCKEDELKWSEAAALQTRYIAELNLMIDAVRYKPDGAVQKIKIGN